MPVTVTYANAYPWNRAGGPALNRPYSEVKLAGPAGSVRIWCLVDSGADRMLVDSAFAAACGISLSGVATVTVMTATGATSSVHETRASLDVDGVPLTDLVRFCAGAIPLLGRITFLNAFGDVGFNATGWLAG